MMESGGARAVGVGMTEEEFKRRARRPSGRGPMTVSKAAVGQAALHELLAALRMFQVATAIDALASGDAEQARTIAESIAESALGGLREAMPHAREALEFIQEEGGSDEAEQVARIVQMAEALLEARE